MIPVDQIPDEQWDALGIVEADREPIPVQWQAPSLNTALLKYPVRKDNCTPVEIGTNPDCRSQVYDIITYGRPGTPMPPWGVQGGGSKNTQAVTDLVNYIGELESTYVEKLAADDMTVADAEAEYVEPLDIDALVNLPDAEFSAKTADVNPSNVFLTAMQNSRTAKANLAIAQGCLAAVPSSGTANEAAITACKKLLEADTEAKADLRRAAQSDVLAQQFLVTNTTNRLNELRLLGAASDNGDEVAQGALLFQTNCARCHTRNWSVYAASGTNPHAPLPLPQGSGALGPSLVDGATLSQFVTVDSQTEFVTLGSIYQRAYGVRGIGSGKMPGFGNVLSPEQIDAIVAYERSL